MLFVYAALSAALSYLCGCFNGAIVVSKYVFKNDIRNHGSGNAGITNFMRIFGGPWTFMVLLADIVKMVLAVKISQLLLPEYRLEAVFFSGLFVLLGHMFPVFFRFKGGKGILSTAALTALADWRIFAVAMGVFLIAALITKRVSVGSVLGAAAFPLAAGYFANIPSFILAAVSGLLMIYMHRENIKRLLAGEEPKFKIRK